MALDPLEDRLMLLKQRSQMDLLGVLKMLKQRLNFISIYSLFDLLENQKSEV